MVNSFAIWLGMANWYDGGLGGVSTEALIPMNTGNGQTACGAALNRMMLTNPVDGNLAGNFYCDGCSGGRAWGWRGETLDLGRVELTPESADRKRVGDVK